ncbi:MAG: proline dehydrogenase family protein, partial [Bacteroidota bacterium]|nr:proline dehydrogenase family protein [Bacteroidota bacterium]
MTNISFENTQTAFEYKSNKELKKARFLFSSMAKAWLVKLGTKITPALIKANLPINGIIRNTIFSQFVGGETLDETADVVDKLDPFHVQVILDYGVEGKEGEESFDRATEEFINVIRYAATQPHVPFMSVKLTGLARFELLEKIHQHANYNDVVNGIVSDGGLGENEKSEWNRVVARLEKICETASESDTGVLIDAEESWIQNPVDAVTMMMMQKFNVKKPVIYNTAQLYRHDRLQFLKDSYAASVRNHFLMGIKLVRGAYMEKERKRADEKNYPSPIQPNKEQTDTDYNAALEFCIEHIDTIYLIVASHNEFSNLFATQLMDKKGISHDSDHLLFSQLYGMSDNITFNLSKAGFNASKYLPFGPIKDVI